MKRTKPLLSVSLFFLAILWCHPLRAEIWRGSAKGTVDFSSPQPLGCVPNVAKTSKTWSASDVQLQVTGSLLTPGPFTAVLTETTISDPTPGVQVTCYDSQGNITGSFVVLANAGGSETGSFTINGTSDGQLVTADFGSMLNGSFGTITGPIQNTVPPQLLLKIMTHDPGTNVVSDNGTATLTLQQSCQVNVTPPPIPGSNWYQLDPDWASSPYDHVTGPQNTIGYQGCALIALNYALNAAGQAWTPLTLNGLMDIFPGDFSLPLPIPYKQGSGGGIIFSSAVMDVTGGSLKFDKSQSGQNTTAALDSYLCSATPLPVIVQVTNPTTGHKHYVVVTGKNGNTYSIVDPGYLNNPRTSLAAYDNQFALTGVVKPPSGSDPSELDFSIVDDATLLVTAPDGTQTGFDPSIQKVVKGAPQAAYFVVDNADDSDVASDGPTTTTYSVQWFLPPSGTYAVQVNGIKAGTYVLAVKAFDVNGKPQTFAVSPGVANVGSTSFFQIQFSSMPGASSTGTRVANFPTTLSDITNSLAIGLIDNAGTANALTQKINEAASAMKKHESDDAREALNSFKHQVSAQSGKHITGVAPQVLLEDADSLLSQLPKGSD